MKIYKRTDYSGDPRSICVCIDGTWNFASQVDEDTGEANPTNVAKIRNALVQEEARQVVGYFPGLGNKQEHWWLGQLLGGCFGAGAYPFLFRVHCWLTENWRPGDRLSIFGFSRGAALARMLANSVRRTGIAEEIVIKRVTIGGRRNGHKKMKTFRHGVQRKVPVQFLGCWDTVASFGLPMDVLGIPFQEINLFKDFRVSANVRQAVHCVALDEQRHTFGYTPMEPEPHIKEVWFAGWHSDVGGGNVDGEDGLGDITLEFMVKEAEKAEVLFNTSWKTEIRCDPDYMAPLHPQVAKVRYEYRKVENDARVHAFVRERMKYDRNYRTEALKGVDEIQWVKT